MQRDGLKISGIKERTTRPAKTDIGSLRSFQGKDIKQWETSQYGENEVLISQRSSGYKKDTLSILEVNVVVLQIASSQMKEKTPQTLKFIETLQEDRERKELPPGATNCKLSSFESRDPRTMDKSCRAGSGLDWFGSNSKLTKRVTFLVCGRCYLKNLSLKIALPARVNKVSREFASKDLVDCYGVV